MANNSDRYEYFRFPLIPTLLSGIFLILMIRAYWEPTFYPSQIQSAEQSFLKNYSVWGPILKYGFERLKSGELPHWDPYLLCGHPYLIEYRTGLFQPLNLFFYLLNFSEAYQITILIGMFLLGISFIIWGRIWNVDFLALIPGAIALTFSGFVVWAQGSITYLNGCVWLSLLMSSELIFLEARNIRSAIVLLIIWCILILSGSIECILTGVVFMLIIPPLLNRLYKSPRSIRLSSWFTVVLITILGIAITSFYWLPSLMWVITEGHGNVLQWLSLESAPSYPPFPTSIKDTLLQLVQPLTNSQTQTPPIFFLGLIPLTMLFPAFFDRESRKPALFQLLMIALCICSYYIDPRIGKSLRTGGSIIFIQSILLLFSLGYNRTFLKGSDITSPYIWGSLLTLLVLSAIMIFYGNIWAKGILIVFVIVMLPLALLRFRWAKIVGCIIISLIIFLELFYPLRSFLPVSYVSAINTIDIKTKSLLELKNFTAGSRIYVQNTDEQNLIWSENLGIYLKLLTANGKWELLPDANKRWLQSIKHTDDENELNLPILTASGIRWICSERKEHTNIPISDNTWRTIEKFPHITIKENPKSLPQAFIVSDVRVEENIENVINQILNNEIDLLNTCLTNEELSVHISKESKSVVKSCIVDFISPEHIEVDIPSPNEGFLVLLDSYASGWKSYVNGKETKVYRTNGIFKGVCIPPETKKVYFIYNTPGWKQGWISTTISFIITLILLRVLRQKLNL